MINKLKNLWNSISKPGNTEKMPVEISTPGLGSSGVETVEIAPNDPIVAYFQTAPGVVEIDRLELDSPALRALKASGIKLTVPLVSQGELIGLLNLGSRLSEQEYSADDRGLLSSLALQSAPAFRVAQLVQQQQVEVRTRERLEQEMRVARLIQQTLLPKELPELPGWEFSAFWQPARAVGGDFYDFIKLPDGRLGVFLGDVTDKGVPAAMMMATTRSVLRSVAAQTGSPGAVLERANNLLCPDTPANMFITCLYAILDPMSGELTYANAGQDLPYMRQVDHVSELRATGMPLGLMPGMVYEQKEIQMQPGETVLFYSDGLVEAHNSAREMFGFERLRRLISEHPGGVGLIQYLLDCLAEFTGPDWEQEDDVTFVAFHRAPVLSFMKPANGDLQAEEIGSGMEAGGSPGTPDEWKLLADFSLPSEPGIERQAMEKAVESISGLNFSEMHMERFKTAVAEGTMNATEHGNHYNPEVPVSLQVLASKKAVKVLITDQGAGQKIPEPGTPNLEAKLAGLQASRGWGLFIIKNMVDELHIHTTDTSNTLELVFYREGTANDF